MSDNLHELPEVPADTPAESPAGKLLDKLPQNKFGALLRRFWLPLVIVVAVVLVLAIFGSARLASPEAAVRRGTEKTTRAIEDRLADSPYQALSILAKSMTSGTLGAEVTYDDGVDEVAGALELTTDLEDLSFMLSGNAEADGKAYDAALYFNKERVAVASSLFPEEAYGVTFETFEDDLDASDLADYLGLSREEEQMLVDGVAQLSEILNAEPSDLTKEYEALLDDFVEGLEWESETEEARIGGEEIRCKIVSTTLDEDMVSDLAVDALELMYEDESVSAAAVAALVADSGYSEEDALDEYEAQMEAMIDEVDRTLSAMKCDFTIAYYLYKNQLVMVAVEGDMELDGEAIDVECVMDFGRDPEKDDWTLKCELTDDYGNRYSLEGEYASEIDGDQYEDSLTVELDDGYSSERFRLAADWDTKEGDLTLKLDNGYETIRFDCNLLIDGDALTVTLDELGGMLGTDTTLEVILTADKGGKVGDVKFVNLDAWDEDTLEALQEAVMDAVE